MSTPAKGTSPLHALWDAQVLVWLVLAGEAIAIVLTLAPGAPLGWIYFGIASLAIQWISLLTLAGLYVLREPLSRLRPLSVAYAALGMLLLAAWSVVATASLVLHDNWSMNQQDWSALLLRITGIALTLGLLGLCVFQNHWRAQQLAVRAKQFELEALKARIRPHFLFNTLNTGAALVRLRPADAERVLLDLAELFRAALAGPELIPLQDELTLTKRYMEIESMRFGDRLLIEWEVPEHLPTLVVPSLSIQPLVENAVRHGIEPAMKAGRIRVEAEFDHTLVRVVVRNSLPPAGSVAMTGHQVGLASVRKRIEAIGVDAQLQTGLSGDEFVASLEFKLR